MNIPESPVALAGSDDPRLFSPAAARNLLPITDILAQHVPDSGAILELGSGSGEHIVHFAMRFPNITWQPSDVCDQRLASIRAWKETQMRANIEEPIFLDATAPNRGMTAKKFSAVICINLLHLISNGAAEQALACMASSVVEEGFVFLYGPFRRGGSFSSDGDRAFHAHLTAQERTIGLKDIHRVVDYLRDECRHDSIVIPMPANNLAVVSRRRSMHAPKQKAVT